MPSVGAWWVRTSCRTRARFCDRGRDLGGSVTERGRPLGFVAHERCAPDEDVDIGCELQDRLVVRVERVRNVRERRVTATHSISERAPTFVDDIAGQNFERSELMLARLECGRHSRRRLGRERRLAPRCRQPGNKAGRHLPGRRGGAHRPVRDRARERRRVRAGAQGRAHLACRCVVGGVAAPDHAVPGGFRS
jgi:hypothetical protein